MKVGDKVRYQHYEGKVREVQSDGKVLLDWLCWPQPFFTGPYAPNELKELA